MRNQVTFLLAMLAGALALMPVAPSLAGDPPANVPDSAAPQPDVVAAPAVPPVAAPVKLPYGVEDVLKLSRAHIGDDIIVNYVKNSGTIYNLGPADLVYLKQSGVSDRVMTAMLDQRRNVELAAQTPPAQPAQQPIQTIPNAPMVPDASMAPASPSASAPTYVQAPLTPPASSVTVIPYPAASYAYYGPYGYYGPYYGGYWGPSVSFAFGFGGYGYYGHGYHGGHGYYGGHGGYYGGHGGSYAHGGHR